MATSSRKKVYTLMSVLIALFSVVLIIPKLAASELTDLTKVTMVTELGAQNLEQVPAQTKAELTRPMLNDRAQCETKRQLAKTIMVSYQQRQDFALTQSAIEQPFAREMVSFAMQLPVMETAQEQALVVNSFGNMIFDDCINSDN